VYDLSRDRAHSEATSAGASSMLAYCCVSEGKSITENEHDTPRA
jgi:hypothetical protein